MSLSGVIGLNGLQSQIQTHVQRLRQQLRADETAPAITLRQGARPVYLASLWRQKRRPVLVIMPRPEDARRLHDQLLTYLGENEPVHLLPEPEVLPFERLAVDARTGNQRLTTLAALAEAKIASANGDDSGNYPPLVITSVGAALRRTLPPEIAAGYGAAHTGFTHLRRGIGSSLMVRRAHHERASNPPRKMKRPWLVTAPPCVRGRYLLKLN